MTDAIVFLQKVPSVMVVILLYIGAKQKTFYDLKNKTSGAFPPTIRKCKKAKMTPRTSFTVYLLMQ